MKLLALKIEGTLQWHPAMAPRPLSQRWSSPSPPTIAHYNGRLQWEWPSNGTTSTTIAHWNGSLQWHPAMAPRPLPQKGSSTWHPANGTQQMAPSNDHVHSPKIGLTLWNGTLQWHHVHSPPAPHHSTLQWQWHHVHSPKVGRHPPPQPYHTTMAPYDGTQQWHHVHCTLQRHAGCHVQSAKVVRRPPPLLEVRTPIAIAIWGKTYHIHHRNTQNFDDDINSSQKSSLKLSAASCLIHVMLLLVILLLLLAPFRKNWGKLSTNQSSQNAGPKL